MPGSCYSNSEDEYLRVNDICIWKSKDRMLPLGFVAAIHQGRMDVRQTLASATHVWMTIVQLVISSSRRLEFAPDGAIGAYSATANLVEILKPVVHYAIDSDGATATDAILMKILPIDGEPNVVSTGEIRQWPRPPSPSRGLPSRLLNLTESDSDGAQSGDELPCPSSLRPGLPRLSSDVGPSATCYSGSALSAAVEKPVILR